MEDGVMNSKWILMIVLGLVVCLQGCETAKGATKGFKQDVHNTWHACTDQNGWVQKADNWVQENMW